MELIAIEHITEIHNVEHIHLDVDKNDFNSLLQEIELDFPHVSNKLSLLIGYPEFEIEINKLIISDRPHRQGFPKRILKMLLLLSNLHHETYKFN